MHSEYYKDDSFKGMKWQSVWLLFLGFYFIRLAFPMNAIDWAIFVAGLVIFLVCFFRIYKAEPAAQKLYLAVLFLTAVAISPFNYGGNVLFIYTAYFAGSLLMPRYSLPVIALIVISVSVEAWWFDLPLFMFWMPGALVSLAVGMMGIFERMNRLAQKREIRDRKEIKQLAAIAERERIARDLHDVIGHTLSAIALKSEVAERALAKENYQSAKSEVLDIQSLARQALSQTRQTIAGYTHRALPEELQRLKAWLQRQELDVELICQFNDLPPRVETAATFIALEACTNIVRHAHASKASIRCVQTEQQLELIIEDNGRPGKIREGNGLRGIRERAHALQGKVTVTANGGTRVQVNLPLRVEPSMAHKGQS